jgi:hypothetical protein
MAVVIRASPNTCGQSEKTRLVVISNDVCSYNFADQVKEQLAPRLAEWQVAQLINDDEITA